MEYIISIFPILIYFAVIKGFDGFSLVSWKRVVVCLVWGLASCMIAFFAGNVIKDSSGAFFPLLEEFLKAIPLIVLIALKRSAFLTEAIVYGAAVGAGFSICENILYVSLSEHFTIGDAILRGFGTALLHIGCTALLSSVAILMQRLTSERKFFFRFAAALVAIIPAYAIHYVYNLFLLPELIQLFVTILLISVLIYLIFRLDERLINRWLDACISNDVALYKAIREGNLRYTNAGQYLEMARNRFNSDNFFDICVYLGLYLEVSIAAKSRMILREAGLDTPLSEEEHEKNRAKIVELSNLRKSIGTSGILFLNPIVNARTVDDWIIKELL